MLVTEGDPVPRRPAPLTGLPADVLEQELVLLAARRTADEVRRHAGAARLGVLAGQLELHVPIDEVEALVAQPPRRSISPTNSKHRHVTA